MRLSLLAVIPLVGCTALATDVAASDRRGPRVATVRNAPTRGGLDRQPGRWTVRANRHGVTATHRGRWWTRPDHVFVPWLGDSIPGTARREAPTLTVRRGGRLSRRLSGVHDQFQTFTVVEPRSYSSTVHGPLRSHTATAEIEVSGQVTRLELGFDHDGSDRATITLGHVPARFDEKVGRMTRYGASDLTLYRGVETTR